jgi:phospholipid/cholesterol/gamma-HCH transport system ATP-binding protein
VEKENSSLLQVIHLAKRFLFQKVLEDVHFTIPERSITVILGPSGVGKSVLLKCMVGLLTPDRGEVLYRGRNIHALSRSALLEFRKRIGMLFQDGALFGSLSVFENVAFPLRLHTSLSEKEIRRKVEEVLLWVGLPGIEKKMPGELSGGMRKRVGLARALVLNPEIVFFDEPTSGLDPISASQIDELILKLRKETGATFVVISHDIVSTLTIGDYVALLKDGRIAAFLSREELKVGNHPDLAPFFRRSLSVLASVS